MTIRNVLAAAILAGASVTMPSVASAAIEAFTATPTWIRSGVGIGYDGSLGWAFTVDSTVASITDLGTFDFGEDGLNTAVSIALWDSAGDVLRTAKLGAGATGDLRHGFRYVSITPISLTPGQIYYVGSYAPKDSYGFDGSFSTASGVNFLAAVFSDYGTGFVFPNKTDTDRSTPYYGASFLFQRAGPATSTAPEPATWAMMIVGFSLIGVATRRRMENPSTSRTS